MQSHRHVRLLAAVSLFVLSVPVLAATPKPQSPAFVPLYPGAQIQMQMTLTEKDFLPVIRQWLSMVPMFLQTEQKPGGSPAGTECLFDDASMKQLQTALIGLKRLSVTSYKVPAGTKGDTVYAYYNSKLGLSKAWVENLMMNTPKGVVRVYTEQGLNGLFGLLVSGSDVTVFRTQGYLNLVAISQWAQRLLLSVMHQPAETQTAPTSPSSVPAPAPPPAEPQQAR